MSSDPIESYLVRVGVPLMAARNYYDDGHPEHQGLGLILLDGATESLLRRLLEDNEMWLRMGELMAGQNAEALSFGIEPPHSVHELTFPSDAVSLDEYGGAVHLSKTQRRRLDREFGPHVDVAVFFRNLSTEEGKALKHLHEYRNGAYHRNVLNMQTIQVLVELQLSVVATLLRSMRIGMTRIYPAVDWEPARAVLGLPEGSEVSYHRFADVLDKDLDLGGNKASAILGGNLTERLRKVDQRLGEVLTRLGIPWLTVNDVIALIQTPQPWPDSMAAIRALEPAVTRTKLDLWQRAFGDLGAGDTALSVFVRFVDIDLPLTEFEQDLEAVELAVDQMIQSLIDEHRGK